MGPGKMADSGVSEKSRYFVANTGSRDSTDPDKFNGTTFIAIRLVFRKKID